MRERALQEHDGTKSVDVQNATKRGTILQQEANVRCFIHRHSIHTMNQSMDNNRFSSITDTTLLLEPDHGPVLLQSRVWHSDGPPHAFTTRRTTMSDLDQPDMVAHAGSDPDHVARSQHAVRSSPVLPDAPIVRAEQVHGARVTRVSSTEVPSDNRNDVMVMDDADGVITQSDDLILMAHSADCPIVFLYAGEAVGLLHASWKGIAGGIPRNGVQKMDEAFDADPADMEAFISPSIRVCCYEVQSDFREEMRSRAPLTCPCFHTRDGSQYFDLQEAITRQLQDAGIRADRITDSGLCSQCRPDLLYSYRRNGVTTGRTAGLIATAGARS